LDFYLDPDGHDFFSVVLPPAFLSPHRRHARTPRACSLAADWTDRGLVPVTLDAYSCPCSPTYRRRHARPGSSPLSFSDIAHSCARLTYRTPTISRYRANYMDCAARTGPDRWMDITISWNRPTFRQAFFLSVCSPHSSTQQHLACGAGQH